MSNHQFIHSKTFLVSLWAIPLSIDRFVYWQTIMAEIFVIINVHWLFYCRNHHLITSAQPVPKYTSDHATVSNLLMATLSNAKLHCQCAVKNKYLRLSGDEMLHRDLTLLAVGRDTHSRYSLKFIKSDLAHNFTPRTLYLSFHRPLAISFINSN